MQRVREALHHRLLHLDVPREHDQRLAAREEVVDPRQGRMQLAARRQPLQRPELREPLRAQRRGDLRVQLGEIERLLAQPRDHVVLRQPVLALVSERDRHDDLALVRQLRQHLDLAPAHEAAPAQVPVQPLLRQRPAELLLEARAGAEVLQPPEHAQLRDQLLGVVEHRRAGQREPQRIARQPLGEPPHRAGALRLRVLAVVRLVEHERARAAQRERLALGRRPARS